MPLGEIIFWNTKPGGVPHFAGAIGRQRGLEMTETNKILFVDDERNVLLLIERLFLDEDYRSS